MKTRKWLWGSLAAALVLTASWVWLKPSASDPVEEIYPYDHLLHITATLAWDGEEIEVDDLILCYSEVPGYFSRAASMLFKMNRFRLAHETADGGMVVIRFTREICNIRADIWAGAEYGVSLPQGWVPLISWFDNRDLRKVVTGETYWSEAALKNPKLRLKIIKDFNVSIPELTPERLATAREQERERDTHQGRPQRGEVLQYFGARGLPMYKHVPEEEWQKPVEARAWPHIVYNHDEFKAFYASLPDGDGLLQVGTPDSFRDGAIHAVRDSLKMRLRAFQTVIDFGVPQIGLDRWGLLLTRAAWEKMKSDDMGFAFMDELYPTELRDGRRFINLDTPGVQYHNKEYANWFRQSSDRLLEIRGATTGEKYDLAPGYVIFDQRDRALWIRVRDS